MSIIYYYIKKYKHIQNQQFNFKTTDIICKFENNILTLNQNNYINLHDKNIKINAIVGENGSGKSTLIESLPFFNDTYEDKLKYIFVFIDKLQIIKVVSNFISNNDIENKTSLKFETSIMSEYIKDNSILFISEVINHFSILSKNINNQCLDSRLENYSKKFFHPENEKNLIEENLLDNKETFSIFTEKYKNHLLSHQHTSHIFTLLNTKHNFLKEYINIPRNIIVEFNDKTQYFADDNNFKNNVLSENDLVDEDFDESEFSDEEDLELSKIELDKDLEIDNTNERNYFSGYDLGETDLSKFHMLESIYNYLIENKINKAIKEKYINKNFDNEKIKFQELLKIDEELNVNKDILKKINFTESFIIKNKNIKSKNDFSFKINLSDLKKTIFKDYLDLQENYICESFVFSWEYELSQGEMILLNLISHIFEHSKKYQRKNILIILDESDIFLHPKWQKSLLFIIINFIKMNLSKFQFHIILTTHSPFILSDLNDTQIIYLEKGMVNSEIKLNTFASNIHDLLSESFFMGDNLMGDFAKQTLKDILSFYDSTNNKLNGNNLSDTQIKDLNKELTKYKQYTEEIGEKYIQNILLDKLEDLNERLFDFNKDLIQEEINKLEQKINLLKHKHAEN